MNEINSPKIIVTRAIPTSVAKALSASFSVEFNFSDKPFTRDELKSAFQRFDGVLSTVSDNISENVLRIHNRRASILSNYGVGVSNIAIEYSKKIGLVVTNTPNVLTDATAEITLFLILAVSRRTSFLESKLRQQNWTGFSIVEDLGTSLNGKTLGIIGMGRIGQATARKVINSLGMRVVFFNRSPVARLNFDAIQFNTLDEVLECSDVVSIHAPGGALSPILSSKHFPIMKKSAFLINTARGDVVDQHALIYALKNNLISGAGLDVNLNEPEVPHGLLALNNVTLLPHVGSATKETREAMGMLAVNNLRAHFFNKNYPSRVV
ncbi:MAG: D-glycerate dehydrogenase [Paracoccaceae bacterium]|nr:D-glycerate dehydrogenase [Paracoccaceae bacterium]